MAPPRSLPQRKADTLRALTAVGADVWVATASSSTGPYLVPLSLGWINERVVLALEPSSRTARNVAPGANIRLGIGPTRDVVLIDAHVESAVADTEVPTETADAYSIQAAWDPRSSTDLYVYVTLRPHRIQAWREANEIAGRTLMLDGEWLV